MMKKKKKSIFDSCECERGDVYKIRVYTRRDVGKKVLEESVGVSGPFMRCSHGEK